MKLDLSLAYIIVKNLEGATKEKIKELPQDQRKLALFALNIIDSTKETPLKTLSRSEQEAVNKLKSDLTQNLSDSQLSESKLQTTKRRIESFFKKIGNLFFGRVGHQQLFDRIQEHKRITTIVNAKKPLLEKEIVELSAKREKAAESLTKAQEHVKFFNAIFVEKIDEIPGFKNFQKRYEKALAEYESWRAKEIILRERRVWIPETDEEVANGLKQAEARLRKELNAIVDSYVASLKVAASKEAYTKNSHQRLMSAIEDLERLKYSCADGKILYYFNGLETLFLRHKTYADKISLIDARELYAKVDSQLIAKQKELDALKEKYPNIWAHAGKKEILPEQCVLL
jgi:hypothetical protein